jgi:hypothetical protein
LKELATLSFIGNAPMQSLIFSSGEWFVIRGIGCTILRRSYIILVESLVKSNVDKALITKGNLKMGFVKSKLRVAFARGVVPWIWALELACHGLKATWERGYYLTGLFFTNLWLKYFPFT